MIFQAKKHEHCLFFLARRYVLQSNLNLSSAHSLDASIGASSFWIKRAWNFWLLPATLRPSKWNKDQCQEPNFFAAEYVLQAHVQAKKAP